MNHVYIFISLAVIFNLSKAQEIIFPTDEPEVDSRFQRCSTARAQCISINECPELYNLLRKNPLSPEDVRYLRSSQCGNYNGQVFVCCTPGGGGNVRPPVTPPRGGGGGSGSTGCSALPTPGVCGRGTEDRIYGGNRTRIDEYPWMALLEYTKPGNQKGFHCGGVLISDRYVVTASHCVNGAAIPKDWTLSGVRLGEWDLSTSTDCEANGDCSEPVLDVPIERLIPHEQYNPNSKNQINDVALLRLSQQVRFTDWISPICLPIAPNLRSAIYDGVSMDVAGWGKTEVASVSNIKLKARVNGVNLQQCNSVYNRRSVNLEGTQICAGGEKGIDSCRGDSGGPLVAFNKQTNIPHYYLVGVVSFGPTPCGLEGWPGVYTSIAAHTDWIQTKLC